MTPSFLHPGRAVTAALYWRGGLASPRVSRAFSQPQAQRFKHPRLSLSLELFHNSGARNASVDASLHSLGHLLTAVSRCAPHKAQRGKQCQGIRITEKGGQ